MKWIGDKVEFMPHVFEAPYTPHYDAYKGHLFEVVTIMCDADDGEVEDHLELRCVDDPSISVNGFVHDCDVVKVAP